MNKDQVQELLENTLSKAKSLGADSAEVLFNRGESFSVSTESKNISQYKVSSAQSLGVRIKKGKKIGTCSSESVDQDAIDIMLKQAMENSNFSKESTHEDIVAPKSNIFDATDSNDFKPDETDPQKKVDYCLAMENDILNADKRVQNAPYNTYSDGVSEYWVANSNGVMSFAKTSNNSLLTSSLMAEEGKQQAMFYHYQVGRTFSELNKDELIKETVKHTSNFLEGKSIKTGKYDIVFSADLLSDVFGCFSNLFSGRRAVMGLNPWKDKIEHSLAFSDLTIKDNPNYNGAFGNGAFDSEGFPTSEVTLMENGVLKSFLQNSSTAKELGMKHTANASRSPRSALNVGSSNIIIEAGKQSESEIQSGEYIQIVDMQGLHSGTDSMSGDFSFGATGYLMKDGEMQSVVRGVTVSGNFFDSLKNIKGLSNKLETNRGRTFFAPKIKFSNLTIAGA